MKTIVTGILLGISTTISAQVSLTYTGNMGVLLQTEDHTLLIDGLHEFYKPAYQNPSPEMVQDLLQPGGKYPELDISLVTHYHGDHYSATLHARLTNTIVIGSEQITNLLIKQGYNHIEIVPYTNYQKYAYQIQGLDVKAFRMDHGNKYLHQQVQNIGYLITMGGQKILHVGDTDWFPEVFEALELSKENIDIAVLPVWLLMYDESEIWLEQYINSKHIVATHIDPNTSQLEIDQIKKRFPRAIFLRTLGEQYEF